MTLYHLDSVVPHLTPLVVQGRSSFTREADPEPTHAIDTALLVPRFTRSIASLPSRGL